ncbi:MAG: PAS domain S-box protein [Bdellovibrionaceae bacterium]|nr:PAS domain S-box protein [Pseudobdellovibrionaceae bacterium]
MKKTTEGLSSQDFLHLKSAIDEAAIVAITDKSGKITYVNKKFCAISKYSESELLGNTHRIINSNYHPKEFFIDMWNTISEGKTWEGEIRNRAKDGSLYWVNTTIVPFMDADGKPERYVAVRYEITERKLAEEQLKIYSKKLEISNQELQDFASVAAHDLQEPLRKIQTFSDRVKLKAKDSISPEAYDYLDRVQASAKRMQILINDLLTYSRVTTKANPFSQVSLNKIVTQVKSDLEIRIEQTAGTVNISNLPDIDADPTQMHQLFQNLISNALKFHKPDCPPIVTISANVDDKTCAITIADNGIGFEQKYADRIFTIFQRLHGRHEYEGTGIGLAVCRKIIDRHGGRIVAQSELGKGSTFIIYLPIKQHTESTL